MQVLTKLFIRILFSAIAIIVLSTIEVSAQIPTKGLVAYYPFNGNAIDESGNGNNGIVNGAALTTDRFGNIGKAYSFDGMRNSINSNYADPITDLSISLWFISKEQCPNFCLFSTSTKNDNHYFALYLNKANQLEFVFSRMTSNSMAVHIERAISDSRWHHVMLIRNNGNVRIFLDGVDQEILCFLKDGSLVGEVSTGIPLYFGANYAGGGLSEFYNGSLDDIRIYDRVLSETEIQALYHENGWPKIKTKLNQIPTKGLVAYYPFNGNANDESGNGNNGTINGATLTTDRFGSDQKAYSFNGSNNDIRIPNSNSLDFGVGDFSFSMWIYKNLDKYNGILSKDNWNNNSVYNGIHFTEWPDISNDRNGIGFNTRNTVNSLAAEARYPISNFANATWYHIVGQRKTNILYLYVNGILRKTMAEPAPIDVSTNVDLWFGSLHGVQQYLDGKLDDFRIYNRALSENEIQALYHEGGWSKIESISQKVEPETENNTPPTIEIDEPSMARGMKVVQTIKSLLVKGKAMSANGIAEVTVNGQEANLKEKGEFWSEVLLAVGENTISVTATDTRNSSITEKFTIVRKPSIEKEPTSTSTTTAITNFGKYYALLIAVQDYRDGSVNNLDYPIRDAEAIRKTLTNYYTFSAENVQILQNPTREEIINTFDSYSERLNPQDNLLIFYAGHGYWDEKLEQGFWLPSDASRSKKAAWLSNSQVREYIRGIKTKHTLLISDACFSGGIFKSRSAFSEASRSTQELYKLPSRKAMTSGAMKEVPDKSIFVQMFNKRLVDSDSKFISAEKLFSNFKDAVISNSPNGQVPQFGEIKETGDEGGDFIFIRK